MHIAVVGAGVFGVWTAHHLRLAGMRVTMVDAYGPANSRASSGDESRIIRCGYGRNEIYSRWARRSLVQWQDIFARVAGGQPPLFHPSGVLWLSPRGDAYTLATFDTLQRERHRVALLDRAALATRFPQLTTAEDDMALFEEESGVLMARRAVQALASELESAGVRVLRTRIIGPQGSGRLDMVRSADGHPISADGFVFACGPWLPAVFPTLLGNRIRPTRQVVMYFGTPPGDPRFGATMLPAWVDFTAGIYGIPDLEHRGVKVGIDRHGPPFDPERDDRIVDAASVSTVRRWLGRRMPALANAPVIESRVCQYENTDSGDFLIDRHPDFDNVWIAGGGSGHGFKHGPAVGEYVAGLVRGSVQAEPAFALAAKGVEPQRSIY